MNYFMAFVIGVLVNLGLFKLDLARLALRNNRYRNRGLNFMVKKYTVNWRRVVLDAIFWGLVGLVTFYIYIQYHK